MIVNKHSVYICACSNTVHRYTFIHVTTQSCDSEPDCRLHLHTVSQPYFSQKNYVGSYVRLRGKHIPDQYDIFDHENVQALYTLHYMSKVWYMYMSCTCTITTYAHIHMCIYTGCENRHSLDKWDIV